MGLSQEIGSSKFKLAGTREKKAALIIRYLQTLLYSVRQCNILLHIGRYC